MSISSTLSSNVPSNLPSNLSSLVATGVAPDLNVITLTAAAVLFAGSIWFLVIAEDIKTSFRRFQKLDLRDEARRHREPARSG